MDRPDQQNQNKEIDLVEAEIRGLRRRTAETLRRIGMKISQIDDFLALFPEPVYSEKLHQLYTQAYSVQNRLDTSTDQLNDIRTHRKEVISLQEQLDELTDQKSELEETLASDYITIGKTGVEHARSASENDQLTQLTGEWFQNREPDWSIQTDEDGHPIGDLYNRFLNWISGSDNSGDGRTRKEKLLLSVGQNIVESDYEPEESRSVLERKLQKTCELKSRLEKKKNRINEVKREIDNHSRHMENLGKHSTRPEMEVAKLAREIGILKDNLEDLLEPLGKSTYKTICRCADAGVEEPRRKLKNTEIWDHIRSVHQYRIEIQHRQKHIQLLRKKIRRDHLRTEIDDLKRQQDLLEKELQKLKEQKRKLQEEESERTGELSHVKERIGELNELLKPPFEDLQQSIPSLDPGKSASKEIKPNKIQAGELQPNSQDATPEIVSESEKQK